jgi:hypothetical protein
MRHRFKIKNVKTVVDYYVCEFSDEEFEKHTLQEVPGCLTEEELAEWLQGKLDKWSRSKFGWEAALDNVLNIISLPGPLDECEAVDFYVECL